ncbi:hypothetical protein [Nocardioides sp.]|uniref:hypothetical protein n=1 Tax=Nocardioides sp. TaxID=35761 RepID=UPI001A2D3FA7|nr:hypothetical protein [Nocardioides sp.]MBJ7359213.1 hypothetical protein [Nocardioides sp.]
MTRRPTPTFLIAVLALVVALAGATTAGYAAGKADGNSLIKKKSLSGNRLKPDSVTGKQVAEKSLGTVPTAAQADRAAVADRTPLSSVVPLAPATGWTSGAPGFAPAGYRIDGSGLVHLSGTLLRTSGVSDLMTTLPAAARPSTTIDAPVITFSGAAGGISIEPNGQVQLFGGDAEYVSLEGVVYLPAS